jgi:hypothetical protein
MLLPLFPLPANIDTGKLIRHRRNTPSREDTPGGAFSFMGMKKPVSEKPTYRELSAFLLVLVQ